MPDQPVGRWILNKDGEWVIEGKDCTITLTRRQTYCDRGRFLAVLDNYDPVGLWVDYADGWSPGRYYFDETRAKLEVEAWLEARKQMIDETDGTAGSDDPRGAPVLAEDNPVLGPQDDRSGAFQ